MSTHGIYKKNSQKVLERYVTWGVEEHILEEGGHVDFVEGGNVERACRKVAHEHGAVKVVIFRL